MNKEICYKMIRAYKVWGAKGGLAYNPFRSIGPVPLIVS